MKNYRRSRTSQTARLPITLFITLSVSSLLLVQCTQDSYPYYLRLGDLKPLFITFVDSSGSMDAYQSSIRDLVANSRERFLAEIYAGDEEAMEDKYFVLSWHSGESWPEALMSEPSDIMPSPSTRASTEFIYGDESISHMSDGEYSNYVDELDEYPVRIYLFYGNGGAASYDSTQLIEYVGRVEDTLIFSRAVVVGVPGSQPEFISSVEHVLQNENPAMEGHNWFFREYDPNEIRAGAFFDDIVSIIRYR